MTLIVEIFPQCDVCDESFPNMERSSAKLCREHMRMDGWKRFRGTDYCPSCADRLLNDKDRQLPPYAKAKS